MWIKQRGNQLGYKAILTLYKLIGYRGTKPIIWVVSFVYALITPKEKEAIKDYYRRVGVSYSFLYYVAHINQFSLSIFDRFVTKIDPTIFQIERVNLKDFLKNKNNKILALSHMGNWANTFVAFEHGNRTIHVTTDEKLKENISTYERSLQHQKSSNIKFINLREGLKASVQMVKALKEGDDLAIMVDRLVDKNRYVEVNFLETPTRFNKNPFEIAYNREVEMMGITVIRTHDKAYKVILSDPIQIDKSIKKEEAIVIMATQYANYLEDIVRQYPKQWFNFYKFWER